MTDLKGMNENFSYMQPYQSNYNKVRKQHKYFFQSNNNNIIMKFSSFALASLSFFEATSSVTSFSPSKVHTSSIVTRRMGYLDDLAADLSAPDSNPIPAEEAREANVMSKDKIVGAGPGDWDSYVEFDEFDGGDGQMGVAGDGNKGLDKFDMSTIAKSKSMSGKNKIIESNQIKSNQIIR